VLLKSHLVVVIDLRIGRAPFSEASGLEFSAGTLDHKRHLNISALVKKLARTSLDGSLTKL
jgi:hypothetical protein